jgi:serine/threonine protein kinase
MKQAVDEARQLGQYTLEDKIGAGAMGAVYRAQHAMLRRPTAIKLLHPDRAANKASLARFENEVQITGRLNHPNTVALYDYGHTPSGLFYYAMEYLQGVELEDLVQRGGPLPPGRAVHILVQICGSLDEAHSLGLIHRDIKPANILIAPGDVAKLADFGLVKDLDDRDQAGLTNVDTLTGTPLYMSPEAIKAPENLGPASDIYAIGALGYFLLTGQPVFDGKGIVDICAKHIHDTPQPPHERLGKPLPADLEGIILQCLAKQPKDRPAGADILANALEHCQDAGTWSKADSHDWWQEHRDLFRQPSHHEHQNAEQDHLTIDLQSRAI